jgi:hypothetical protein
MSAGCRIGPPPDLRQVREFCAAQIRSLPRELHQLNGEPGSVSIELSDALRALAVQADANVT